MVGEDLLEEDVIGLLQAKGIHSEEELNYYRGKDKVVLQLQFLVKRRLIKLQNKLEKVKQKSQSRTEVGQDVQNQKNDDNYQEQSDNLSRRPLKTDATLPGNMFRLSEAVLVRIDVHSENLMQEWAVISLERATSEILKILIPEITGKEITGELGDLLEVFLEAATLAGENNACDFFLNLDEMKSEWLSDLSKRKSILRNYLDQIIHCAQVFVYNDLFQKLLERKISRVT